MVACSEYGVFRLGDSTSRVEAPCVMVVRGLGKALGNFGPWRDQRGVAQTVRNLVDSVAGVNVVKQAADQARKERAGAAADDGLVVER